MCKGGMQIVEVTPITGELGLHCGCHAFVQVSQLECYVHVPHPFIADEWAGKEMLCPEHDGQYMMQLAVVATSDKGQQDMAAIGDQFLDQCDHVYEDEATNDCPTCKPIRDAEMGFHADPDGFLTSRDVTCPLCPKEEN